MQDTLAIVRAVRCRDGVTCFKWCLPPDDAGSICHAFRLHPPCASVQRPRREVSARDDHEDPTPHREPEIEIDLSGPIRFFLATTETPVAVAETNDAIAEAVRGELVEVRDEGDGTVADVAAIARAHYPRDDLPGRGRKRRDVTRVGLGGPSSGSVRPGEAARPRGRGRPRQGPAGGRSTAGRA